MINPGAELGEALFNIPEWLMRVPIELLRMNAKVVYARLFQWSLDGIKADVGAEEIGLELGIKLWAVELAIRELKKAGLIKITKKFTGHGDIKFLVHPWMGFDLVDLVDPDGCGPGCGPSDTLGFATLEKVMLGFAGKSPVPLRDLSAEECVKYAPMWLLLVPDEELSMNAKVFYLRLADWFVRERTFGVTIVGLIRAIGRPLPVILEAIAELKRSYLIMTMKDSVFELWHFYLYVHPWMKNEDAKLFYTSAAPGQASQSELAAEEAVEEIAEEIAGETVKEIRNDARILH